LIFSANGDEMDLSGKKVLVTGSEGFIGSHLVEVLLERGCRVRGMVLYNSFNSWGWLDAIPEERRKRIEVVLGDVRDKKTVEEAVNGAQVVFHLAALISIPYSYNAVQSFVETNVVGTLNVLQSALEKGAEKVLVTSTSEVYGSARYVPIDEGHQLQAQSPYSASKIAADKLAESFHASFGLNVTVVRPFNTYGPRQSARAVIPTIVTQLLKGKQEILLGNLSPKRDLLFVKDTVEGFVDIAESDAAAGEQINIATQTETSIGDLAMKIIGMINPAARVIQQEARFRPDLSEVMCLNGSNEKIKKLTGWVPRYTLDQGLEETIAWFRNERTLGLYKHELYNY